MSDVKRYDPINQDGTCGVCIEDADYGAYVEYADYAALEAELARLRAGQEPVATVKESQYLLGDTSDEISELLPIGTKLYTAPQPSAVPVVHGLDADDVRAACQNAVEVFAEEQHAELCREVAEYMREVLLADLERAASPSDPATVQGDAQLLEALEECAASLAWNCFGECRAIHAGPIMPAQMALETARAAIAAAQEGGKV